MIYKLYLIEFMLYLFSNFLNSASLVKGAVAGSTSMDQSKTSSCHQSLHQVDFEIVKPESLEKRKEEIKDMDVNGQLFRKANCRTMLQNQLPDSKLSAQRMSQQDFSVQYEQSANVFSGKLFCFSNLFPEEKVSHYDLNRHKLFFKSLFGYLKSTPTYFMDKIYSSLFVNRKGPSFTLAELGTLSVLDLV